MRALSALLSFPCRSFRNQRNKAEKWSGRPDSNRPESRKNTANTATFRTSGQKYCSRFHARPMIRQKSLSRDRQDLALLRAHLVLEQLAVGFCWAQLEQPVKHSQCNASVVLSAMCLMHCDATP